MQDLDAWGLYESRIERYPVLSVEDQEGLFALYDANRTAPAARQAFTELAGSNWRLAKKVINDILAARESTVTADQYADLASEANVALVEAIESYDPAQGGTISNYIATAVERRIRQVLSGDLPAIWSKVRRIASGVEQNLMAELGRRPSALELEEGVRSYAITWALERLIEAGEPATPEAAKAKLVRQGMWAAIARLAEIRSYGPSLSLDTPIGDGISLLDTLADADPSDAVDVMRWFLQAIPPSDLELLTRRFGLDGKTEARLEDLATERSVPWPVIRTAINAALGRMYAPHAQYASLAPDLESRFEEEDDSAASRFSKRRSLATRVRN